MASRSARYTSTSLMVKWSLTSIVDWIVHRSQIVTGVLLVVVMTVALAAGAELKEIKAASARDKTGSSF